MRNKTAVSLLLVLLIGLLACDGAAPPASSTAGPDLEDRRERASYAQGYVIGRQGEDMPIDVDAFVAGVRDGLVGQGKLTEEQLEPAILELRELTKESRAAVAVEERARSEAFLAENALREGVQVTESGLQYEVLEPGDGPKPTAADTVTVHYRGTLIDGTEFDSSYTRGEPTTFSLQAVVPGWTEGLQLMPLGARYRLWVPTDLAYGDAGRPSIPPGATLVFEIHLLHIADR